MREFVILTDDWAIPNMCPLHNNYGQEEGPGSGVYRCYANGVVHLFAWRELDQ